MIAITDAEFDTKLLTGIQIGLSKARELGYPVERMDVTASMSQGQCLLHFAPLAKPGMLVTGGDLSLAIDPRSKEIKSVERGQ